MKKLDNERIMTIILTVYIFNSIILLLTIFMPYMLVEKTTRGEPRFEFYYGIFLLIFGGWFGYVFICISMGYLYHLKFWVAVYFGFLGSGLLIFNFLIILYIGDRLGVFLLLPGYFIGLSVTLTYFHINILISILIKTNVINIKRYY